MKRADFELGLLPAAAGILSLLVLARSGGGEPFRWIGLIWIIAFAAAAALSCGRARVAAANMSCLSGVLLAFELYLSGGLAMIGLAPAAPFGTLYITPHSTQRGGPLGRGPVKNRQIASKKLAAGAVVYDVVYSIDENGFRRTPPLPEASPAVLFLGDSITFGEGVADGEAFPAVFQAASGHKAINLAYSGYGPHQMLRLLETGGEIPATARYRPVRAYYLFHAEHVDRTAGNSYWNPDAPRYEVDPGGLPRYRGPWRGRLAAAVISLLARSAIARWGWSHWAQAADWKEGDFERFAAVVAELRRVFKERYRGDFQVLLLWGRDAKTRRIMGMLRRRGVAVTALTEAVPELGRRELYLRHDGHPGPTQHRALGLYLARRVAERRARKHETR